MKAFVYGKTFQFTVESWDDRWFAATEHERSAMNLVAAQGKITDDDGVVLEGGVLQRVRDRLLSTYDDHPIPETLGDRLHHAPAREEQRWLVPGLWPWGTFPMLGGNQKAGKTHLVTDLVPALVVPGYRFLGRFEPAEMTEAERRRGVWLINAETDAATLESALAPALDVPIDTWRRASDLVVVDHLEHLGGAAAFDLTDRDTYAWWAHRLMRCDECDGSDDEAPFTVVVDGVTAILQAAGKSTDHYGLWYAAFRRLMREIDVPNALAVGHTTMTGGHLMGGIEAVGGPDGLWTYSAANPERWDSLRRFGVVPRMGGAGLLPTVVDLGEDGRLVMREPQQPQQRKRSAQRTAPPAVQEQPDAAGEQSGERQQQPAAEQPAASVEEQVLDYVRRCNAAGHGPTARGLRANVEARNPEVDAAAAALVASGRLQVRERVGRGGGSSYWLTDGDGDGD